MINTGLYLKGFVWPKAVFQVQVLANGKEDQTALLGLQGQVLVAPYCLFRDLIPHHQECIPPHTVPEGLGNTVIPIAKLEAWSMG